MTIATDIQQYTSYNTTDISNAVTASTRLCAALNIDDDTSIEKGAIWLLERQTLERKARSDDSVVVPKMAEFDKYIMSLTFEDQDEATIVAKYTSPHFRDSSKSWYNPT